MGNFAQESIPYRPWDERYIFLHLPSKLTIHVGKYTVRPMYASWEQRYFKSHRTTGKLKDGLMFTVTVF